MPRSADSEQKIIPFKSKTQSEGQVKKGPSHSAITSLELDWYYMAAFDSSKKSELHLRPRFNLLKGVIEIPCPNTARCGHMKAA